MKDKPDIEGWMEYCFSCKKKHRVTLMKCPECGVYLSVQPISEKVLMNCYADYECEGCIAYREHLRI